MFTDNYFRILPYPPKNNFGIQYNFLLLSDIHLAPLPISWWDTYNFYVFFKLDYWSSRWNKCSSDCLSRTTFPVPFGSYRGCLRTHGTNFMGRSSIYKNVSFLPKNTVPKIHCFDDRGHFNCTLKYCFFFAE